MSRETVRRSFRYFWQIIFERNFYFWAKFLFVSEIFIFFQNFFFY